MDKTTTVLIVDDHAATRRALVSIMRLRGLEVCGQAENGREALAKVSELRPDVVVLDVVMPETNGLYAASEIRRIAPSTKIVLISLHFSRNFGSAVLQTFGADAYVEKSVAGTELAPTITHLLGRAN
jgi:DNA-binding NarL/FixJ family response regulator